MSRYRSSSNDLPLSVLIPLIVIGILLIAWLHSCTADECKAHGGDHVKWIGYKQQTAICVSKDGRIIDY